jgi:hypothetical protein
MKIGHVLFAIIYIYGESILLYLNDVEENYVW